MNNSKCCVPYMFVLAVVMSELARDIILAPYVGPQPQTQQHKQPKTLMPIAISKISKILKKRQLDVVSSPVDGYQNLPAAFVPSKVPRWRTPPYLNILIPEHHIASHMIKVNVMAKLNTVPDTALNDIEKFLDI